MSYTEIVFQESNVSRRILYFSMMSRTQTGTPQTLGSGATCAILRGGAAPVATANNLVISDKTSGIYSLTLNQSECSVMGSYGEMAVLAGSQASFMPVLHYVRITAVDSGDSMRYGLLALPNAAAAASGGLLTVGTGSGSINPSSGSVAIIAGDYGSSVTVGVSAVKAGTYSGVTVGSAATILAGTYSGVTLGINNIAAGAYSGVTISGATASNVLDKSGYGVTSIAAGTYSGVTVGSLATLAAADYTSKVTVGIGGYNAGVITTAAFAAAALDSTVFATNAEQAFADRLLLRSVAGGADSGHTVGHALMPLRNKVDASSSVGTVYLADGSTSAWTFSTTTAAFPLASMSPS